MSQLSIIVPIYNGSKYLNKCIDSIIAQVYTDFELILVDDGSTDNSLDICKEYAEKDKRIVVLHKKNEGLVAARKSGLDIARGNYIGFVDCDDYIDDYMYRDLMYAAAKDDSDIVVGGIVFEYADYSKPVLNGFTPGFYSYNEIKNLIIPKMLVYSGFVNYGIIPGVVVKVFKKEILKKALPNVNNSVSVGEDVSITSYCMISAKSLTIIDSAGYHYVQYDNSMIRKYDVNRLQKIKRLHECLSGIQNKSFQKQVDLYMCSQVFKAIGKTIKSDFAKKSDLRKTIKNILSDAFTVSTVKRVEMSGLSIENKIKIFMIRYKLVDLLIFFLRRRVR